MGPGLYDAAAWNSAQVEEMLINNVDIVEWDEIELVV
jgi:hypothetical protein